MTKYLAVAAAVAAAGLTAGCATESGTPVKHAASSNNEPAATTNPVDPPPQHEEPDSRGKFTSSCDFLMTDGGGMNYSYSFVASAKLRNTGNIGIVVRAKATWDQVSDADVTATKSVTIRRGHSKTLKFKVPIDQSQVDQFQGSPDYFSSDACRVKVRIVGEVGQTPLT